MAVQDYLSDIQQATGPAKEQAVQAGTQFAETLKGGSDLSFKLKEALNEKLGYNKDLIEQKSQAMADYFSAPSEARAKYEDIFNPFQREALTQRYTAQQLAPYQTLSSLLEQRMGSVADVVGQGVAGWQGVTQAAGQMANLAQNHYQSAFQEYSKAAEMQNFADQMKMQAEQMEQQERLAMLPYEQLTKYQQEQLGLEKQKLSQSESGNNFDFLEDFSKVKAIAEHYTPEMPEGASEYRSLLGQIDSVLEGLKGEGAIKTGVLAQFLPEYAPGGGVRNETEALKTAIRKQLFGTAVTETEAREAGWLPEKGKTVSSNIVALDNMRKAKERELRDLLQTSGLDQAQINSYITTGNIPSSKDMTNQLLNQFNTNYMYSYEE